MWTLHDAKNKFSAVVDAALAGVPQSISRRGRPAVVVVSAVGYQQLLEQARLVRGSFAEHLLSYPQGAEGGGEIETTRVTPRAVEF